jgi:hypothetical protein
MPFRDERETLRQRIVELERQNQALRKKLDATTAQRPAAGAPLPWQKVEQLLREADQRARVPRVALIALVLAASVVQLLHGRGISYTAAALALCAIPVALWAVKAAYLPCPACRASLSPPRQAAMVRARACPKCGQKFSYDGAGS